jgi:hypothetical protein
MTQQARMGVEIAKVAIRIGDLLGCSTCAMGIAIGAVGERYGYAPFDNWRCNRLPCVVRKDGVPPAKLAAISEIILELPSAEAHLHDLPPAPARADSRLPPERDDEAPL